MSELVHKVAEWVDSWINQTLTAYISKHWINFQRWVGKRCCGQKEYVAVVISTLSQLCHGKELDGTFWRSSAWNSCIFLRFTLVSRLWCYPEVFEVMSFIHCDVIKAAAFKEDIICVFYGTCSSNCSLYLFLHGGIFVCCPVKIGRKKVCKVCKKFFFAGFVSEGDVLQGFVGTDRDWINRNVEFVTVCFVTVGTDAFVREVIEFIDLNVREKLPYVSYPFCIHRVWNHDKRSVASSCLNLVDVCNDSRGSFSNANVVGEKTVPFCWKAGNSLELLVVELERNLPLVCVHAVDV